MASLIVQVEYADLPFISDRTARSILKDLSKAVRHAQAMEVDLLLKTTNVGRRDRQSIKDRMRTPIQEGAVYYVEELIAGSLWGKLTISGFAIWLLSATVGETVKDAWKETEIHRGIIEYVKNERPSTFANILENTLRDRELLTGRAHVFEVTVEQRGEDTVISIYVQSDPDNEIDADTKIEGDQIVEAANRALDRLSSAGQRRNGGSVE